MDHEFSDPPERDSATSGNHQEKASQLGKIPKPNQNPGPNKKPYSRPKPRFTKPSSSKVSFDKKIIPSSISTRVLTYYHPIHTSTSGIEIFADEVYTSYASRDARLEKAYSPSLLRYVSLLALTYRIFRLGNSCGYILSRPKFLTSLRELIQDITLPSPIAELIESVGKVAAPQGICFVPHVPSLTELKDKSVYPSGRDYFDDEQLSELDGVEPKRLVQVEELFLNADLVVKYMSGSAVAAKFSALYRKVDWKRDEGDLASVVAFHEDAGGLTGYAPFEMEQVKAQLGACYRLRVIGERTDWYGTNECYRLTHSTDRFLPGVFITDVLLDNLKASTVKRQDAK